MKRDLYIRASVTSTPSGWQRPEHWPDRPIDFESHEGVYYLVELFQGTKQYLFWNSDYNTDIYFDDSLNTTTTGGVPEYITIDDTFGFDHGGRRFTWIYFDIDGVNPYINLANNNSTLNPNSSKILNVQEVLVNKNLNYFYGTDGGFSHAIKMYTQNMWFKPGIVIQNSQGLFINRNLDNVQNIPILRGSLSETFRDCNLAAMPNVLDFTNTTTCAVAFYSNINTTSKSLYCANFGSVTSIAYAFYVNYGIVSLEFDDCSGVVNADTSFYLCKFMQRLIVPNLAVTFNIQNCYEMSKEALLEMIASLADLSSTSTQNILMTNVPDSRDTDVVNAATAKNWTIVT